jgi:uncharacterized protein
MEMSGEQRIAASQQAVWDALVDPAVLKTCIPGCEAIDRTSDTEYALTMLAAVGPVKARFKGRLSIGEIDAPTHYLLSFEGSGGPAGFGKGSASVTLAPVDGATRLSYLAKAQVGGKLAQVGSRLIDGVAKKMADDFFGRFNARFAPKAAATDAAEATAGAPAEVPGTASVAGGASSQDWGSSQAPASSHASASPNAVLGKWCLGVTIALVIVAIVYAIAL